MRYARETCAKRARNVCDALRETRETCAKHLAKHAKHPAKHPAKHRRHTPFHHLPALVSHYGCTLRPQKYPYDPHKMITTHFPPFSGDTVPTTYDPPTPPKPIATPPRRRRETARNVRETCVMHCAKHAKCARNTLRNTRNTPRNAASYASHTGRP